MRAPFIVSLFVVFFLLTGVDDTVVQADVPAGYQEYYVPGGEQQLWDILWDLNPTNLNSANGMHAVISVVAAEDTTIYYDHWEDTYDFDPANPVTSADETVTLLQGQVHYFESSGIPINPRGTSTHYDGMDRIYVVGGPVTVSRASWTDSPNVTTLFALAWEVYPTKPWLTNYVVPVGEDLYGAPHNYEDFQNVYVVVEATQDTTTVQIDDPTTALSPDVNIILNQGQVTQLHHVGAGTTVNADKPIQTQFIVGTDGSIHGNWEIRGYTAVPEDQWDDEYYIPVGSFSSGDSDAYIYNPSATTTLTVNWEDSSGSGSFTISPGDTESYEDSTGHLLPEDSAAYLSGSHDFWAIGSVDTEWRDYDWGYSCIPVNYLMDDYTIGWAPSTLNKDARGSYLFVTPEVNGTTVYVDYDDNGSIDDQYVLNRLDIQQIDDTSDYDMTGAHVWSTHPVAIVWGEDPDTASVGYNYLDLGYTTLPIPEEWVDLVLTVDKSVDPVILPTPAGQTATFRFDIFSHDYPVNDVNATDTLPGGWSYVSNSTYITLPDSTAIDPPASEPSISGQDLIWNGMLGDMNPNETIVVTFDATTTIDFSDGDITWNVVEAIGEYGGQTFTASDEAYNEFSASVGTIGDRVWNDANGDGVQDVGEVGINGVTVDLIGDTNGNGAIDIGEPVLATKTTAGDGDYDFTGLTAGDYIVDVTDTGGVLTGFTLTTTDPWAVTGLTAGQDYNLADFGYRHTVDLELTKTVDDLTPDVGDTVTFTITVYNDGPSAANNITVEDVVPSGYTYVPASIAGGDSRNDSGAPTLTWAIISLASKATSGNLTFDAKVNASGTYINPAQVTTCDEDDVDSTPNNDDGDQSEDDEDNASVSPNAVVVDLWLTKTVDNATPALGDTVVFTVTVTNDGPATATNVAVGDILPPELPYVSDDSGGSYDSISGVWIVGTLTPGTSATLHITAQVPFLGTYTNIAEVIACDQQDLDSTPNNHDPSEDDQDSAVVTASFIPIWKVLAYNGLYRCHICDMDDLFTIVRAMNIEFSEARDECCMPDDLIETLREEIERRGLDTDPRYEKVLELLEDAQRCCDTAFETYSSGNYIGSFSWSHKRCKTQREAIELMIEILSEP
jgi:uncharacterized repeat protein (TIGR01451 family)